MAIPIHTTPEHLDHVLAAFKPCPLYDQAHDEYLKSDEIKSVRQLHQSLIQYMEKHSGMKNLRFGQMMMIFQAFQIESSRGYQ